MRDVVSNIAQQMYPSLQITVDDKPSHGNEVDHGSKLDVNGRDNSLIILFYLMLSETPLEVI